MVKFVSILGLLIGGCLAAQPQLRKSFAFDSGRIVGGSLAADGQYPHQISLQVEGIGHNCGGSIVNSEWVVTAAHCVDGETAERLSVLTGTNSLSDGGTTYAVREIHQHENYDPFNIKNDVAILKVDPITYSDKVKPVALEDQPVGNNVPCTISGWGYTGSEYPNDLKQLDVVAVTPSLCADQEICTLAPDDEGTCFGDSGGPLIRRDTDVIKQVGITSWVFLPCGNILPDGFASVPYFIDWFRSKCNNCV